MGRCILKIDTASESAEKKSGPGCAEKRKNPRIPICVPVSCVSVDSESRPLDHNMGIVRDISRSGIGIEAGKDVASDRLILTFVDLGNNITEIAGQVVFSKKNTSGTFQLGVLLQGEPSDIIRFVEKLVKYHHYSKKSKCID